MMTVNMQRVFALNCVLNGHTLFDGYSGDINACAESLEISVADAQELNDKLLQLEKLKKDSWCQNKVTRVVLNLFRTREFAFIQTPSGPIYLQEFAMSDRRGQINDNTRQAVLASMITDIQYVKSEDDIRYFDGLLMIPHSMTNSMLQAVILEAYRLYRDGPGKGTEPVLKYRYQMTVATPATISSRQLLAALRRLVKDGYAPSSYARSTLMIADWLPVYRSLGCLCEHNASRPGYVNISMSDPEDVDKTVCMTVSVESISSILRGGMRKLGSATCERLASGKANAYRLVYGGVPVSMEG